MTIKADGFSTSATRVEGARQDKVYPDPNQSLGIVWHSQEGTGLASMVSIHNGDARKTSFMFWIDMTGTIFQFSPVTASTWTSGNKWVNTRFWSVEIEGFKNTPINRAQIRSAMIIIREWEALKGKKATRYDLPDTGWTPETGIPFPSMVEHREIDTAAAVNAGATACPSERYVPLWEELAARTEPVPGEPGVVDPAGFNHGTDENPIPDPYDKHFNEAMLDRLYFIREAGVELEIVADRITELAEAIQEVGELLGVAGHRDIAYVRKAKKERET